MIRIGVLGASGQVGTEVCLFLTTYADVHPVGLVRTYVSGALLRRFGVDVRVGTLSDQHRCKALLGDCDLVVDFSVNTGEVTDIKTHYQQNITRALDGTHGQARYVFISTINAFGMSTRLNRAKHYILPHSTYAHTKRYAERLTMRLGRQLGRETYVFRLGHVHGLLQRVSEETRQLVRCKYRRFEYPDTPSYTIFCHTIAEGLVQVARGRERPGIYTLISEPPWTWREVLEYYARPDESIQVDLRPVERPGWIPRLASAARRQVVHYASDYRETLRTNILRYAPSLERRAAASIYIQRAQKQIEEFERLHVYRPLNIHEGVFPGPRLSAISDSRVSMAATADQVRKLLNRLPAWNANDEMAYITRGQEDFDAV